MSTANAKSHGVPQGSNRVCEWCATSIPEQALKCPHCTKWRKDIQKDINLQKTWLGYAIGWSVPAFILIVGAARNGVWGEGLSNDFSVSKFLSSFWGWLELFLFAAALTSVARMNHYAKSVNRKTGVGLPGI